LTKDVCLGTWEGKSFGEGRFLGWGNLNTLANFGMGRKRRGA